MAKQTTNVSGGILGKIGGQIKQAYDATKGNETTYSNFSQMPAGITNGVAQLSAIKFDVYKEGDNKGQVYLMAQARCLTPDIHTDPDGVTHETAGMVTKVGPLPLCQTKNSQGEIKTIEDNVNKVLNELRKLGVPTATIPFEQLEGIVQAMDRRAKSKEGPHIYFKFSTLRGKPTPQYPEPRTFEEWGGLVKYEETNGETGGGMEEDASEPEPTPSAPAPKAPPTQGKVGGSKPTKTPAAPPKAPEPEPEPEGQAFDEFGDIDSLVSAAEQGDMEAQNKLTEMAETAGIGEQAGAVSSWEEVGKMLTKAGDEGSGEEEESAWVPAVKEIYAYTPTDPKTRKPLKQVIVKVVVVDESAQTVDLSNIANPKMTYKNIPWDKLEAAS